MKLLLSYAKSKLFLLILPVYVSFQDSTDPSKFTDVMLHITDAKGRWRQGHAKPIPPQHHYRNTEWMLFQKLNRQLGSSRFK